MNRPKASREPVNGCDRCWPTEAEAAWQGRSALTGAQDLIDESHFHAMILTCGGCGQRFLSVFTETIDWVDGEDPQYWTLLPITEGEAADLLRTPSEAMLHAIGPDRRSLLRDFPKGADPRVYWSTGMRVGPHD
jgi:hypothetical protein